MQGEWLIARPERQVFGKHTAFPFITGRYLNHNDVDVSTVPPRWLITDPHSHTLDLYPMKQLTPNTKSSKRNERRR